MLLETDFRRIILFRSEVTLQRCLPMWQAKRMENYSLEPFRRAETPDKSITEIVKCLPYNRFKVCSKT